MALELYRVEYTRLGYSGPLSDRELDFLEIFQTDDGSILIPNKERLDGIIENCIIAGWEIPEELVAFLSEYLTKRGNICLHIE